MFMGNTFCERFELPVPALGENLYVGGIYEDK